MSLPTAVVLESISLQFWWLQVERFWQAETPSPSAIADLLSEPHRRRPCARFVYVCWVFVCVCVCAGFVSWVWSDWIVACGSVGFLDVGQWIVACGSVVVGCWSVGCCGVLVWFLSWCDCCCGVVVCLLCMKEEKEKDRDDDVYDEYFIVMFTLFYCVER